MEPILVYVTIGNLTEAQSLSKTLVSEKLVACANILPTMQAIYAWKGEIMSENEVSIIFKTTAQKWEKLKTRIVEIHPYECPCILSISIRELHEPYLEWINQQVS